MPTQTKVQTNTAPASGEEWAAVLVNTCDDMSLSVARGAGEKLALLGLDDDSVRAGFLAGAGEQDKDALHVVLDNVSEQTRTLYYSASQLSCLLYTSPSPRD